MITKYKVSEVAKDFGVQSKVVSDILGKYFDDPKKSSTALDSKELDVLFDVLTQENSVENFNSYFAMKKVEEKKPEINSYFAYSAASRVIKNILLGKA